MDVELNSEETIEAFATFGQDLILAESGKLGAKEPLLATLIDKAMSWVQSQEPILRKMFCTRKQQLRPEIATGTNMVGMVATAIRNHYGDNFPYGSAAAALVSYGLLRFCMMEPESEPKEAGK
jgi:hypothetical protein